MFVSLGTSVKGQRKIISRDTFTKCGESTNYSKSYSGIDSRTLGDLPRLTSDDKAKILGKAAIGAFAKERVNKDIQAKGRPFFWGEWKPIMLYDALFKGFEITDAYDLTIGYHQCDYSGVCYNQAQLVWVRRLLQQCFYALVSDGKTKVEEQIVKRVQAYFQRAVAAARQWLPSRDAKAVVVSGIDDIDMEE